MEKIASNPLLSLRDLNVTSAGASRLRLASLEVPCGTSIAVIGPNGAGKTTLLEVISGLLRPTSGEVFVMQRSLSELSVRERARHIAYLRQAAPPHFDFPVAEYLSMGWYAASPTSQTDNATERVARARSELCYLDAEHLYERTIGKLSSGEYQRVRMARVALSGSPLWLLDEPTANLDPRYKGMLLERCMTHQREGGSVVAVVHDLTLVERYFDRVIMLKSGEIMADGAVSEILDVSHLSELYDTTIVRGESFTYR